MRKIILSIVLCHLAFANAQTTRGINGEANWLRNWTNFKPKTTEYKEVSNLLVGAITQNTTLYKKDIYLLTGNVYVANGATLTIEPGTLIKGDYESNGTLVITKGSKIIAQGDETNPIIFTSNKPTSQRKAGDWGGLIILGESPTNKFTGRLDFSLDPKFNVYGGENTQSNSGILKYIRIEFAGGKGKNTQALNGLSLAGVGNKTIIDNIQVSFSNANSFECYGGTVNLDHLLSFRTKDNDYNFTEGTQCKITNSIAVRNPFVSSSQKSRCFEIQSYDLASNADLTKKMTAVIASNVTLLNEDNSDLSLTREAIFVRENSFLNMSNSVVSGFNQCLLLDGKIKTSVENLGKIKLQDMLFNNCSGFIESEMPERNEVVKNWYNNDTFAIALSKSSNFDFFKETDIKKTPDYRMKQNQTLVSK
ncbi:MAG: hypothetical protein ABI426_06745 [Flavobacterium sp.]